MNSSWLLAEQTDYSESLTPAARNFLTAQRQHGSARWEAAGISWDQWTSSLPDLKNLHFDGSGSSVMVGLPEEVSQQDRAAILSRAHQLCPWKKGPFTLFGQEINAEWRSDFKWDRIKPHLNLKGKRILDIGCHNGYYMFRMAADAPALVIGLEPVSKPAMSFQFLQHFARQSNLYLEPIGIESCDYFPEFFDVVLCLGILYHHTDPINLLRKIRASLAPTGELWVDCQGIGGEDPYVFVPPGRYGGASGIWWVPSSSAVANWLHRAGFRSIETIYSAPLEVDEQRRTEWAPIKSLSDFLDPNDLSKTVEGHPAPWRHYLRAKK